MEGMITVDVKKCVGCRSCEIGCAVEHSKTKALFTAIAEKPLPKSRVVVETAGGRNLPLQCRHCQEPPCLNVCPTGAIIREDAEAAVLIKQDLCIGCRSCILVCPFGAVTLSPEQKAILKCDLCAERTSTGQLPACVSSCPTLALQFTTVDELIKEKRREFMVEFLKAVNL